jgi:hypothetical protein
LNKLVGENEIFVEIKDLDRPEKSFYSQQVVLQKENIGFNLSISLEVENLS